VTTKQQEQAQGFEFSKVALKAEQQDREKQREHQRKTKKGFYAFVLAICALIVAVVVYALIAGFSDIALEIIKAVVFVVGGGIGGYGLAHRQKS
jgi:lipopolysaccharide/colanic/teichoic acid biosynthesis glycosyltransferase